MFKVPPNREILPSPKLTCPNIWLLQANIQTSVLILTEFYLNQWLNVLFQSYQ